MDAAWLGAGADRFSVAEANADFMPSPALRNDEAIPDPAEAFDWPIMADFGAVEFGWKPAMEAIPVGPLIGPAPGPARLEGLEGEGLDVEALFHGHDGLQLDMEHPLTIVEVRVRELSSSPRRRIVLVATFLSKRVEAKPRSHAAYDLEVLPRSSDFATSVVEGGLAYMPVPVPVPGAAAAGKTGLGTASRPRWSILSK